MTGMFTRGSLVPALAQQQGSAVQATIAVPPKTSFSMNYGQDSTWHSVALDFYNHTAGESNFAQELPAMDFATDAWFLAADQKSVELMSGHVRNVYNYLFSQSTNHSWLGPQSPLEYTPSPWPPTGPTSPSTATPHPLGTRPARCGTPSLQTPRTTWRSRPSPR